MNSESLSSSQQNLLSHNAESEDLQKTVARLIAKTSQCAKASTSTAKEQENIIHQLTEFPLGIFLLQNRGTDGFWTDYMIEHQYEGRLSGCDSHGRNLTDFERFILDKFPLVVATQQRAVHFRAIIQRHITEGAVMASLPCGLMRDLLSLDYRGINTFKLVGIDLDQRSLALAEKLASDKGLANHVSFYQADAWEQLFPEQFTLLTSNGLNVYEPDDKRVTSLYRQFFQSLVPGGVLVTSSITPPPDLDSTSDWDFTHIDQEALRLQRILFSDILQFNFAGLRSASKTKNQLEEVGFENIETIWDDCRVFPTIVACKPN
jgi:SAM-dependent methyltransferase